MKKIVLILLIIPTHLWALTVTCPSENFANNVKLEVSEDANGRVTKIKQITTEKDISGPTDIIKEKKVDLFGGDYKGERKAYFFGFNSKDIVKNPSLKTLKDKAGLKDDFESGMFTIIVNYATWKHFMKV